jgi:hypothetical protein
MIEGRRIRAYGGIAGGRGKEVVGREGEKGKSVNGWEKRRQWTA